MVIAGHTLEKYDVTLYAYFSTMLSSIFFPNNNPAVTIMLGTATFAAGYIMRPLGAIIFGHVGDKRGRKKALLNSIFYVTFPTLIIGMLPTYQQIGLAAPIILILCRLWQGLCAGGEYSGAAVFIFEHTNSKYRGFAGSIMSSTAFLGAVFGSLVGSLTTFFYTSELAWRLPFLLGGTLGIIIYFFRKGMVETPMFEKMNEQKEVVKIPLINLLKTNKLSVFCAFLMGAQGHIILYMITIYINTILIKNLELEKFQIMLLNTGVLSSWFLLIPVFGMLSDRINKAYLVFLLSLGLCIFSYPLISYLHGNFTLSNVILSEVVLSIFGAGLFGVTSGFLPQLFKTNNRYSGVAFGQTLGQALLGGTAPLIATFLSTQIGEKNSLALLLTLSGFLGVLGIVFSLKPFKTSFQDLSLVTTTG